MKKNLLAFFSFIVYEPFVKIRLWFIFIWIINKILINCSLLKFEGLAISDEQQYIFCLIELFSLISLIVKIRNQSQLLDWVIDAHNVEFPS